MTQNLVPLEDSGPSPASLMRAQARTECYIQLLQGRKVISLSDDSWSHTVHTPAEYQCGSHAHGKEKWEQADEAAKLGLLAILKL